MYAADFIIESGSFGVDSAEVLLFALVAIDHIWLTRNLVVNGSTQPDVVACLRTVLSSYSTLAVGLITHPTHVETPIWQILPEGWIKLNFDVVVGSNEFILAAVARDHTGDIASAVTNNIVPTSPLVGECQTALLALSKAASRKYQFCIIEEGDSQIVLFNLNDESSSWKFANSVAAIKALCHQFMVVFYSCL
ncbi:hypothetical protein PanWU01x14_054930 [Parasponia andersonii]|uniref:RNase H type-1 domain-containing protein n=1 Tax=Parasponia andersonii TaxID=3476 RepID=A0A2P5DKY8_PARAD|nr:hypothetical protein PanWU01x14_054930 [Parasponia andersonii]